MTNEEKIEKLQKDNLNLQNQLILTNERIKSLEEILEFLLESHEALLQSVGYLINNAESMSE